MFVQFCSLGKVRGLYRARRTRDSYRLLYWNSERWITISISALQMQQDIQEFIKYELAVGLP